MIELRPASPTDSRDIYEMIVEIGPGENGYVNAGYIPGIRLLLCVLTETASPPD